MHRGKKKEIISNFEHTKNNYVYAVVAASCKKPKSEELEGTETRVSCRSQPWPEGWPSRAPCLES